MRLGVNYRTPAEIMELAARVDTGEDPSFEPPGSVRSTGETAVDAGRRRRIWPARCARAVAELTPEEGRLAVIAPRDAARGDRGPAGRASRQARNPTSPVPWCCWARAQAKGLEFDHVLVVEPGRFGTSDLYVALTRATQRLGIVHREELPESLR